MTHALCLLDTRNARSGGGGPLALVRVSPGAQGQAVRVPRGQLTKGLLQLDRANQGVRGACVRE